MTNYSGKFLIKEPEVEEEVKKVDPVVGAPTGNGVVAETLMVGVQVPECPGFHQRPMDKIRRWFGEYWWVWLILLLICWEENK